MIEPNYVNILCIIFDFGITHTEIPFFRGAILDTIKDNTNILYHNHLNGKFRYNYLGEYHPLE